MAYYKVCTADTQVKVGFGKLKALFFSAAASTPTLAIYDTPDGDTSDAKIIDTFTPVAATSHFFGDDGMAFNKGLYLDIGNTVTVTVVYE